MMFARFMETSEVRCHPGMSGTQEMHRRRLVGWTASSVVRPQQTSATCGSLRQLCHSCGFITSDKSQWACSCKTRYGARAKRCQPFILVVMDESRKKMYKSCFVEDNLENLFDSGEEEYYQAATHFCGRQTNEHERSVPGIEEHSAAATSHRYFKNSTSWNKVKDDCEAAITPVADTERCGSNATSGAAFRDLIRQPLV
ncbi:hypothetical protein HPB51_016425 [Rhipicephalus microplus]|uniref:Uncharacterized protein n=1 Tax=Rhipicephalus microplus TaxID=6941 RepID=A0A9J6DAC0_RHIMP|nr:hypothetical protein HPB51_016425 [Rhipicephalus microplus]